MTYQDPDVLEFYDREVVLLATEKYGMGQLDALRRFTTSETHSLLADAEMGLTAYGAPGVFDMWEAEMVTGDPRNSVYVRSE